MALKRLTRDHRNMHKRHLLIGDAMAVISSTQQRSIIVSDCSNLPSTVGVRSSFILRGLASMGARRSGTVQTFLPATVLCASGGRQSLRSTRSRSWSQTRSGVDTCLLTQATQTGTSASTGDAQCESEWSGQEATLPARVCAIEKPESAVSSHIRQEGLRKATSPAVWALRQGVATENSPSSRAPPFALLSGRPVTRRWKQSVCGQVVLGISLETVPNLSVGVVPQRKVLRRPRPGMWLPKSWRQWLTNGRGSARD